MLAYMVVCGFVYVCVGGSVCVLLCVCAEAVLGHVCLCSCLRAETLRSYFSQYGEVVDCVIMKDKTTNQSRGFGFVKFKDPNCVGTVLASRPHTLDGRNVSDFMGPPIFAYLSELVGCRVQAIVGGVY